MNTILSVVDTAYRATQEEQDDAALWLNHALINAGAGIDVLLQGSAVNYAVAKQDPSGLVIGSVAIEHPAIPPNDLRALQASGARIFVDSDDVAARGISLDSLAGDFDFISKKETPDLFQQYEQVWQF